MHRRCFGQEVIESQIETISVCVFDLTLPDGSGYELCSLVKENHDVPVLFLTAVDDEGNVVKGLDMGADDYITKPFRLRELLSRIRSVLRRYEKKTEKQAVVELQSIRIHVREAKVYKRDEEILMTALEYRLLMILPITSDRHFLVRNYWSRSGMWQEILSTTIR